MIVINEAAENLNNGAENFVEALGKGSKNAHDELSKFFNETFLPNADFQLMFAGKKSQFVAAARVSVQVNEPDEFTLSMPPNTKILFWQNSAMAEYERTGDCDQLCKDYLNNLTTTGTSNEITKETTIHTELKMLYGKMGRGNLMEPAIANSHIIVMYTYSVPCSQLRCKRMKQKGHYAECAGDLKNYRQAKVTSTNTDPMIINLYSAVFFDRRNKKTTGQDKTNEDVSNLYLRIGGIPSYKVYIKDNRKENKKQLKKRKKEVPNVELQNVELQNFTLQELELQNDGFERYIKKPSGQIFPRLTYARQYNQSRRFVKCLVEDDNILREIFSIKYSSLEVNIVLAIINTHLTERDYKEVAYRILHYMFVRIHEPIKLLFAHIKETEDEFGVCIEFGKHFDGVYKYQPFQENLVGEEEESVCREIIFHDIFGFIGKYLCPVGFNYFCAEYWCNLIMVNEKPRLMNPYPMSKKPKLDDK